MFNFGSERGGVYQRGRFDKEGGALNRAFRIY